MADRKRASSAGPAPGGGAPDEATTILEYHCRVCELVTSTGWVWGPYAAAGLAAVLARGAAAAGGPVAVALAAALPAVLAAVLLVARRAGRSRETAWYAGAVAILAAGWIWAVGTRTAGSGTRPLWWLAAGAALATAGALPRWVALLAAARRHEPAAADDPPVDIGPTIAAVVKHAGKAIHPVPDTLTAAGGNWSVRMQLTGGQVLADIARVLPRAESELGLREGALSVTGTGRRDHLVLTCAPQVVSTVDGSRTPRPRSITEPLTLGVYQDGRPMRLRLYRESGAASGMLGGRVGSGKSRTIWAQLAEITAAPDVVVMMADLSGGVTSGPWRSCLALLLTDTDDTGRLLTALIAVAEARSRTLVRQRSEVWQPTPEHPAIVVYVDEAQKALGYGATARAWENMQATEQAFQVLRKAGITVILSGPRPEQGQGISPAIRSQCTIRLCLAADASTAGYVFDGTPQRVVATEICPTFDQEARPGQILGAGPGMETVPGLVTGYSYDQAEAIAAQHAARRPTLDALSAHVFARYDLPVGTPSAPAPASSSPAPEPVRQAPSSADRQQLADRYGTWSDADDRAAWALFGEIDQAAATPLRVGDKPVTLPPVDVPPVPRGRMSYEQALQVAAALVVQPGGTTPAQVRAATGYPTAWSARILTAWHRQGLVTQPEQGRYAAVPPP